jgi:hypothetical protein
MESKRRTFEQIIRMPIGRNRHLVLSKSPNGDYSLAQQLEVLDTDSHEPFQVFLKNALIMEEGSVVEFSEKLYEFVEKNLK